MTATAPADNYWDRLHARLVEGPAGEALLVQQFRAFYAELTRIKRQVQRGTYAGAAAVNAASEDGVADPTGARGAAPDIQERFVSMFADQKQAVRRQGGEALMQRYRRVQYAMVALADEVFLNVEWDGRSHWYDHLLESRQFDSQNAGVRVFDTIDRVLGERSQETDVATVYLYILILGFEGRYRDAPDATPLETYRQRLYRHIQRREAQSLDEERTLSVSAYRHTLDQGDVRLLPNLRWWLGALAATGVLYLVLSTGVWWWYTDDLAELANQILTAP